MVKPVAEGDRASTVAMEARLLEIPDTLSVKQLADLLQVSAIDVIKQLMRNGIMANINQTINYEAAAAVVTGFGYQAHLKAQASRKSASLIREIKKQQRQQGKELAGLKPRPPVVTVMGHVDHGKTRLLDAIRQTNVMDSEAGGITQHIGAYQVEVNGQKITFLDTPGHVAFTAMRARGAQITDIAILVVAADDGVMPQTLEAIDHARAAGVPIVVAINKIDKPEANPEAVKQQLADAGLLIEEWGGDTICVLISAREKVGISELLENLLVVAEMEELKADPAQPAAGVVIEAKMDKTKGPLATVLVHNGTLRSGDTIVVGDTWGRLKAMFNDTGKQVRKAEPASPVEILGLNSVPREGDTLTTVADEHQASALIEKRKKETQALLTPKSVSLSNLFEQVSAGRVKELNIILKTDVQGSIEPIRSSLEQLATDEVKVRVIRSGSGNITESDVMLAAASKGIIIGFTTGSEPGARRLAELEGVSIRHYDVIYNLIDDVNSALKGMLEPSQVEVIEGRGEVRAIFPAGKRQKIAGVYVTEGKISRGASVRVRRHDEIVSESIVSSLKRFKEDVREVATGYECGLGVKDFSEFEVGDILELFRIEETG
ncbi:MAG: translation initiation factor IF-2 [Chloroflexi bacterium]|nr:translation initiation factor IF-2 [Chloroflexota bacterium]MBI3930752.1 translation initiation factor IF-2 [Chloroflexota bacterium]